MTSEVRPTEYFCLTCPETLLVYAETSQTLQTVYTPGQKKPVTLIFDDCYCPTCQVRVWVQRTIIPES
jgi:hypothetical protein